MPKLRFNARPHHELIVDGVTIPGGEARPVSDEAAERALADPTLDVTIIPGRKSAASAKVEVETPGGDAGESDG